MFEESIECSKLPDLDMSIFDNYLMKLGWWFPRYGFYFDYGFGFIYWSSTLDRWWAFDDLSKREMDSDGRNDVLWHDESISGIWERKSTMESYWKIFLNNGNVNPRTLLFEVQDVVELDMEFDNLLKHWCFIFLISVHIYNLHITWMSSWMRCFIHIELVPIIFWDIFVRWSIIDLRYSFYDMWLHGCIVDIWNYSWWADFDVSLVWDLPWFFTWVVHRTTEVDYNVSSMASCERGYRSSL